MKLLAANDESVEHAAALLRRGGLVAMPTETVYGLAAVATDPHAVARVFQAKGRPRFDPLIVHIASVEEVGRWVQPGFHSSIVESLMQRYWPGPLTLVLPKLAEADGGIPDLVTAGLPSVAIRVPAHPVALQLIQRTGRPLAAPSANRFAAVSPTTAAHVAASLGGAPGGVDLILDGGPCTTGIESTVLSLLEGTPRLLRPGGTPLGMIEAVTGPILPPDGDDDGRDETPRTSPGSLARHYAPTTPLTLHREPYPREPARSRERGLLVFQDPGPYVASYQHVEILSVKGDTVEAAARLFAALHRLDAAAVVKAIDAHPAPDAGLGLAINDRLRRAATPG